MQDHNYAFIDGQNLNLAIRELGWKLDFKKFRTYLKDKNKLKTVLVPNERKYSSLLRKAGEGKYIAFMNNLKEKLAYKKKRTP